MQNKLERLYEECIYELSSIGIQIINNSEIGEIDINLSKRNNKRYGCCKQENPDYRYYHLVKRNNRYYKKYDRFLKHHIEISKWVMDLDDTIIKNTIIHEIIHCFPGCNNHGKDFKKYANYINEKLGYNISRTGNKEADYSKSNIDYIEPNEFKYKIICKSCGQIFYRKRLKSNILKRYRCGKCQGKLFLED